MIMPALYIPVIVMLLALVFRGVAFEFRSIAQTSKTHWNVAFAAGSTLAAFCQGVILGGLIQGIRVENGAFAGGAFDWATPFALSCGLGVIAGYALLGATWLVMKTDGELAERARAQAKLLLLGGARLYGVVSLWTPLAFERIAERWFSLPNILYLWPVPLVTALVALRRGAGSTRAATALPFFAAIGAVPARLSRSGDFQLFPYLVPPSLTIWDTAAAPASQMFMLVGTLILLPIDPRLYGLCLLAVPRQGARGRELSLTRRALRRQPVCSCVTRSPPSPGRAPAATGPAPARSNTRGTSGVRSGKRARSSGRRRAARIGRRPDHDRALAPDLVAGHPWRALRRGIEIDARPARRAQRDQRRDARIAGHDGQRLSGSPFEDVREKYRPMSCAGCAVLKSTPAANGRTHHADRGEDRRNEQKKRARPGWRCAGDAAGCCRRPP